MMKLGLGSFLIEYDRDYGIDKRRGWSVAIGGAYVAQLERWLIVALWKAWRTARRWRIEESF